MWKKTIGTDLRQCVNMKEFRLIVKFWLHNKSRITILYYFYDIRIYL